MIPDAVTISGRVLDAGNESPVPQFQVTPGRQSNPRFTWIRWQPAKSVSGTNGNFKVELPGKGGAILFTVEAEGYLPLISEPLTLGQSNCVLRLKRGSGPKGMVRAVDGKPLAGVKVYYLAGQVQVNVREGGTILDSRAPSQQTDPEGRFSFPPKVGQGELVVACTDGFGRLELSAPEGTNIITLQPWAQVRGRLVQKGKPLAQEHADIQFDADFRSDRPWLHLSGTVTDDDGHFSIQKVPPGSLRITTRSSIGSNARTWMSQIQKRFTAKPGEDLDLGDVEKSTSSR